MVRLNFSKLVFMAALILAAEGCTREPSPEGVPEESSMAPQPTSLKVKALPGTAYAGSMTVWALSSGEIRRATDTDGSLEMELPSRERTDIFVALNPTGGSDTENPFEAVTDLSEVDIDAIPCFGGTTGFVPEPGEQDIKVSVRRVLAKITLGSIVNHLSEAPFAGQAIRIDSLFIINGKGRFPLFADDTLMSAVNWFMPSGARDEGTGQMAAPPFSGISLGGEELPFGMSARVSATLYCGPNPLSEDSFSSEAAQPWTPRKTRLVLACRIGGERCYYPLTINDVRTNTHYSVSTLTITRFGTSAPDLPFSFDSPSVGAAIVGWDEIESEEII